MGQTANSIKLSALDYVVATLLIASGGNQVLTSNRWYAFILLAIMFVITLISVRNFYDNNLLKWEAGFAMLAILQIIFLSKVSLPAYFNFAVKLWVGYLMANFLGERFRYAYFKVMVFFSLIGLILFAIWTMTHFSLGLTLGNGAKSLLVWVKYSDMIRNQGMFWEPGAYQGYILLAPLMFIGQLKELWIKERFGCIILIIALLTTLSTTGYIVFAFILGMYFLYGVKNMFSKFFLIVALSFAIFYSVNNLDFLGEKISTQFTAAQEMDYSQSGVMVSRMGTMYIDWEMIKKHPIIGNGFSMEYKYGIYANIMNSAGNGLTGFIATMGIVFFLCYILCVFKRCPYNTYYRFIMIVAIMLIFYGESFFNYIPFWTLLFVKYNADDILSKKVRTVK
jgi:hypothetical protein